MTSSFPSMIPAKKFVNRCSLAAHSNFLVSRSNKYRQY